MLRVMAYTGGRFVPSARFRVRQYIAALNRLGIDLRECPARFGSYPPMRRPLRAGWGILSFAERFGAAVRNRDADVTLLQREMLSTFATAEPLTKPPRIFDVDDAIWLARGGRFAKSIARLCHTVACGNTFIAEFFEGSAANVTVLPTAVDTERFRPASIPKTSDIRRICWSGVSSGFRFLHVIEPALAAALRGRSNLRLRIISNEQPRFESIPARSVEFLQWSEATEVEAIRDTDVGIMPLDDSLWSEGKCSYKLLLYMSCGLPVIATPVGMNRQVLGIANAGFAARTTDEWVDAIRSVLNNQSGAAAMGAAGRAAVVRDYSLNALAPKLASILRTAAAAGN